MSRGVLGQDLGLPGAAGLADETRTRQAYHGKSDNRSLLERLEAAERRLAALEAIVNDPWRVAIAYAKVSTDGFGGMTVDRADGLTVTADATGFTYTFVTPLETVIYGVYSKVMTGAERHAMPGTETQTSFRISVFSNTGATVNPLTNAIDVSTHVYGGP
jgi:hypothetical protein